MVDEFKRLSDDEILKGNIESMAADFAAKHQIKLPVLEEELECSTPSLTPGNAPVTVRGEIPFEGEKDLFACYAHYAPVRSDLDPRGPSPHSGGPAFTPASYSYEQRTYDSVEGIAESHDFQGLPETRQLRA